VSGAEVDTILRATTPNLGFYVAVTLVALVAPHVAAFGYLAGAILLVVRAAAGRRRPRPEPDKRSGPSDRRGIRREIGE
jgi:hypothetical protein